MEKDSVYQADSQLETSNCSHKSRKCLILLQASLSQAAPASDLSDIDRIRAAALQAQSTSPVRSHTIRPPISTDSKFSRQKVQSEKYHYNKRFLANKTPSYSQRSHQNKFSSLSVDTSKGLQNTPQNKADHHSVSETRLKKRPGTSIEADSSSTGQAMKFIEIQKIRAAALERKNQASKHTQDKNSRGKKEKSSLLCSPQTHLQASPSPSNLPKFSSSPPDSSANTTHANHETLLSSHRHQSTIPTSPLLHVSAFLRQTEQNYLAKSSTLAVYAGMNLQFCAETFNRHCRFSFQCHLF